ncbi:MAG TPA: hypothetical protein PLW35_00525 [Verrucomicrobiota bacterium]|nr:hypothetical protein [Verrucomicrobiota bacterium]
MGVGRREAFGVRQLAAALSLCPNNVSVPISQPAVPETCIDYKLARNFLLSPKPKT